MENKLNISQEKLNDLSIEQLAELKVEVDELAKKLDNLIEACNKALNS